MCFSFEDGRRIVVVDDEKNALVGVGMVFASWINNSRHVIMKIMICDDCNYKSEVSRTKVNTKIGELKLIVMVQKYIVIINRDNRENWSNFSKVTNYEIIP